MYFLLLPMNKKGVELPCIVVLAQYIVILLSRNCFDFQTCNNDSLFKLIERTSIGT